MRLDTITSEDWQKFEDNYPGAYSYLLNASLQGEWRALKSLGRPNAWEIERLKELNILWAKIRDLTNDHPTRNRIEAIT